MFQKKENQLDTVKKSNAVVDTIIGESASMKGNIHTAGNLRIDGQFEGEIRVQGAVVIGNHGFIDGNIIAATIVVYGDIHGNVICDGILEISNSGKLSGDSQVKRLVVRRVG